MLGRRLVSGTVQGRVRFSMTPAASLTAMVARYVAVAPVLTFEYARKPVMSPDVTLRLRSGGKLDALYVAPAGVTVVAAASETVLPSLLAWLHSASNGTSATRRHHGR